MKEKTAKEPEKTVKFYSIKDEIRILGIDDGPFDLHAGGKALLVGVIYRGGKFLDGVLRTEVTVDGTDSTEKVAEMVCKSKYKDIRVIMIDGLGFAGFNLVDLEELFEKTGLPVIAVVRDMPDFAAIEDALDNTNHKDYYMSCIKKAGRPKKVETKDKKHIYIQYRGITFSDAEKIVKLSSTRSLIPEPLRVAHLIASGIVLGESRGGA
jgi:endonuclease V-like protein UPF0215 family